MENLKIAETKYTPSINFDASTGEFSLVGKSYPENTFEFFEPMMVWLAKYFEETTNEKTILKMEILYFNSSSSKLFFDLFDIFEENMENGKDIEIQWIYDEENESALEAGEDFQEDFESLNFNLVKK